jgi:hypothetical protein
MKHKCKVWRILMMTVVAALVAGCGTTNIKLGFQESERRGHWDLQYGTFTAREVHAFSADAGDTLVFDYKVRVDKGELALSVENPNGETIFDLTLTQDERETVRLPLDQGGRYSIVVDGRDTGGKTDLDWKVE